MGSGSSILILNRIYIWLFKKSSLIGWSLAVQEMQEDI